MRLVSREAARAVELSHHIARIPPMTLYGFRISSGNHFA